MLVTNTESVAGATRRAHRGSLCRVLPPRQSRGRSSIHRAPATALADPWNCQIPFGFRRTLAVLSLVCGPPSSPVGPDRLGPLRPARLVRSAHGACPPRFACDRRLVCTHRGARQHGGGLVDAHDLDHRTRAARLRTVHRCRRPDLGRTRCHSVRYERIEADFLDECQSTPSTPHAEQQAQADWLGVAED